MPSEKKDLANSSSQEQNYDDSSDIQQKESKKEGKNQLDQSSHIQHDTQSKQIISYNLPNETKFCEKVQTGEKQSNQELQEFYKSLLAKENKRIYLEDQVQKYILGDKISHQTNNFSNPQVLIVNAFINDQIDIPHNFMMNQANFYQENRDNFHDQQIHHHFSSSDESQQQRSISDSNVQTQEDISKFYEGSNLDKDFTQQK